MAELQPELWGFYIHELLKRERGQLNSPLHTVSTLTQSIGIEDADHGASRHGLIDQTSAVLDGTGKIVAQTPEEDPDVEGKDGVCDETHDDGASITCEMAAHSSGEVGTNRDQSLTQKVEM